MNIADLDFRALPVSERLQLVTDIWDSIANEPDGALPLSDADKAEFHRRLAAHQADLASAVAWVVVWQTLFANRG